MLTPRFGKFLVYGSGDVSQHASPNHARASLNVIVEPGLYRLLRFQKAAGRGNYETGNQAFSKRLRFLTIRVLPNGCVRANIEARNVILHGRVHGDIHASERVELLKSASLTGNISTARILIEDGAFFTGTIDMQKPEPALKIQTKPPATAAAAVPVAKQQGSVLEQLAARKSRGSWSK